MAPLTAAALQRGPVSLRVIRVRDWRAIQRLLAENRTWLQPWEATSPTRGVVVDTKDSIRGLLTQMRDATGLPFVIEYDGEVVGQLNVAQITYGSLSSSAIGYWVAERVAGHGVVPVAVALTIDYLFTEIGLHRVEICIRPENAPSLRVVEKLGLRYEGLRRSYIHIAGAWRDHFAFEIVREEVPEGVLARYLLGAAPTSAAVIPEHDRERAQHPLGYAPHGGQ